jgi:ribosome biogenesis GTPase / thiamine phosphate phosphatase
VREGTVVEYHREYCLAVLDDGGREVLAKPRGRLQLVAREQARDWGKEGRVVFDQQLTVGDRVSLSESAGDAWTVEDVHERETWLLRKRSFAYKRKPQCVAANADQLAVVIAPREGLRLNVVDRYFMAAIQGGLAPLLVVNKLDLEPRLPERVELKSYAVQGYRVYFTAAQSGAGLEELREALAGQLSVFCGHSGVGKSTILSALTGLELKTGEVLVRSGRGRQTTVTSRLYSLPGGPAAGGVVDTPGVREFGLMHLTWLDLQDYFADIAELSGRCAYRDCSHQVEPDCAVRQAIAAGTLAEQRLQSYTHMRDDCEAWKHWE